MSKTVSTSLRPADLPDYDEPPLNEVVLGAQFVRPQGYESIRANEVWDLFRKEYPKVQELPALPPSFETFGLPQFSASSQQIPLRILTGTPSIRFWFLREDGDELIQFQPDRLLHNWRKVEGGVNSYPRFEHMIECFKDEIQKLQTYFETPSSQSLQINQCEVSYINHIEIDAVGDVGKWLNFFNVSALQPENFSAVIREVIPGKRGGHPQGRLTVEATSGLKAGSKAVILLTLTARGAPEENNIDSTIEFLNSARLLICNRFTELTTGSAHLAWGKKS